MSKKNRNYLTNYLSNYLGNYLGNYLSNYPNNQSRFKLITLKKYIVYTLTEPLKKILCKNNLLYMY